MAKKRSFRIEWAPPCKGSRRQPRWYTDRPHSGTSADPETVIVWQPIGAALATAGRLAQQGLRRSAEVGLNIAAWRIGTGSKSTGIGLLPSEWRARFCGMVPQTVADAGFTQ